MDYKPSTILGEATTKLAAELGDFVLIHNYFMFGNILYLQVNFHCHMSPCAIIFMVLLEQCFIHSYVQVPPFYLRFTDDRIVLNIWTPTRGRLSRILMNIHLTMNMTMNMTLNQFMKQVHFLDTQIQVTQLLHVEELEIKPSSPD